MGLMARNSYKLTQSTFFFPKSFLVNTLNFINISFLCSATSSETLGTEWIDRGVRVNCISPGIVDTPLIHSEDLRPLVQRWLSDIPAGRLAQVTDLQAAVVYLASDVSDYMTGHNLVIEGGQSLW
uniref:Uncharacterized protein n=1 Tax=Poecilia mexicana TaxID=48701 RepID=A0A3B3XBU2_9TELE